ncbi:MAG TPA: hypothetical protein EYP03_03325 [Aquificae bacterium]|nr:hypothetical protein [Aquificota bacterium]
MRPRPQGGQQVGGGHERPHKHPCYYGIDTPTYNELIASKYSTKEIAKQIGADSLAYLSIDGLLKACKAKDEFCLACFNGDYVV